MQCFGISMIDGNAWCQILNGVKVPEDCKTCRFKKPEREVTNGKRYPAQKSGYIPKYAKYEGGGRVMAIPKETADFLEWLDTEVGDEWFAYVNVDVRGNTFMIKVKDEDGADELVVWRKGKVKYKGSDEHDATVIFEKERKKHK